MDSHVREQLARAVAEAIARARSVPIWGRDDCVLFAAEPIRAVLGYDPAAAWRGRYTTRDEAIALLAELGGLGFALRRAARRHGWRRIEPIAAEPGDPAIARFPAEGGHLLTTLICRAPGWFVARSDCGFVAVRAHKVRLAWSLG